MTAQALQSLMHMHRITVKSVFVPWKQSRNAKEKSPSLNWRVTLEHNGRAVLTTDYSAGMGHCPSYPKGIWRGMSVDEHAAIVKECSTGIAHFHGSFGPTPTGKRITPEPTDVLYSLIMDAEALEYARYEQWAQELGYDPDSRKGEALYRACLEIALQMRAAFGDTLLAELREAASDI